MNSLILAGNYHKEGDQVYIQYLSPNNNKYLLPIVASGDFKEGDWVKFVGVPATKYYFDPEFNRNRKLHYGQGRLEVGEFDSYQNELKLSNVALIKVDPIRTTPKTLRKICDFALNDGVDTFNCIAFGREAETISNLPIGTRIDVISARFQSRPYMKEDKQMMAYEILVGGHCISVGGNSDY